MRLGKRVLWPGCFLQPQFKERTINRVRTFLKAHQPVTAAR